MRAGRVGAAKAGSNRRVRKGPTRAYLDTSGWPRELVLVVDDVVTKNERHRAVTIRGSKKTGKKDRASVIESVAADALKEAVRVAVDDAHTNRGFAGITTGVWRLEVLSVWPTQRHLADGLDVPFGDSDSPLGLIRDALQHAGAIDNDIRVVCDRTVHAYEKGERRTFARLRPADADDLRLRNDLLIVERQSLARMRGQSAVPQVAAGQHYLEVFNSAGSQTEWVIEAVDVTDEFFTSGAVVLRDIADPKHVLRAATPGFIKSIADGRFQVISKGADE